MRSRVVRCVVQICLSKHSMADLKCYLRAIERARFAVTVSDVVVSKKCCWDNYPKLWSKQNGHCHSSRRKAFVAEIGEKVETYDKDTTFCFKTNARKQASGLTRYIDSGATSHMTLDRACSSTFNAISPTPVQIGGKSTATVMGDGTVQLHILVEGEVKYCTLENFLFVPSV